MLFGLSLPKRRSSLTATPPDPAPNQSIKAGNLRAGRSDARFAVHTAAAERPRDAVRQRCASTSRGGCDGKTASGTLCSMFLKKTVAASNGGQNGATLVKDILRYVDC